MNQPEVARSADCGNSPKNAKAEDIALALMGIGALSPDLLEDGVVWDRPNGSHLGRARILAQVRRLKAPDRIHVDQVISHGRAASVTGRYSRPGGEPMIFCHVLRFASASARTLAQIVSFEHPDRSGV